MPPSSIPLEFHGTAIAFRGSPFSKLHLQLHFVGLASLATNSSSPQLLAAQTASLDSPTAPCCCSDASLPLHGWHPGAVRLSLLFSGGNSRRLPRSLVVYLPCLPQHQSFPLIVLCAVCRRPHTSAVSILLRRVGSDPVLHRIKPGLLHRLPVDQGGLLCGHPLGLHSSPRRRSGPCSETKNDTGPKARHTQTGNKNGRSSAPEWSYIKYIIQ